MDPVMESTFLHAKNALANAKVSRHIRTPLSRFQNQAEGFEQIHVDVVRPLPTCRRFKHILTIINRYAR